MHQHQLSSSLNLDTHVGKQVCTNEELTVMSSEKSDGQGGQKGRPSEISEQDCEGNLKIEMHQQNYKLLQIKNRQQSNLSRQ